ASRSEGAAGWVAGAAGLETLLGFPLQSSAWGAAELCSARTIARGRAKRGGGRADGRCRGFGNPPRVSITIAWGAAELCSARTIAGRFGNPLRVSITIVSVAAASAPTDGRTGPDRLGRIPGIPTRAEPGRDKNCAWILRRENTATAGSSECARTMRAALPPEDCEWPVARSRQSRGRLRRPRRS